MAQDLDGDIAFEGPAYGQTPAQVRRPRLEISLGRVTPHQRRPSHREHSRAVLTRTLDPTRLGAQVDGMERAAAGTATANTQFT
jgi:hypothetical protein